MNLFEINKEIELLLMDAVDQETGELLAEAEDSLDSLEMEREEKLLNCAKYIKGQVAFLNALKEEKKNIDSRIKTLNNQIDQFKGYVLKNMDVSEKFKDAQATISTRKSTKVDIESYDNIPDDLMRIIPESREPDKTAISKKLKDGEAIEGAQLITNYSLQVK